jgi:H+-transporting ATPase
VFHVERLQHTTQDDLQMLASAIYLQVSTISQTLIFVTRSCLSLLSLWHSWYVISVQSVVFYLALWVLACLAALLYHLASCLDCFVILFVDWYSNYNICELGIGWGWTGVIWLYNIVSYFPPNIINFLIRYALSGRA